MVASGALDSLSSKIGDGKKLMIFRTDYTPTTEHTREMVACAEIARTELGLQRETLNSYTALHQYYEKYLSTVLGLEFLRATQLINRKSPLRILDVGVGRGETSLYLADHGHHISVVEPSYEFCLAIDYVASRFGKELTIYSSAMEHLHIPHDQFDLVIFNVCLHHCDDPSKALKVAYNLLVQGGQLLVISEPMLPFFKSHESVMEELVESPEELGHYGGNEHSYYYKEYISMIRGAGFRDVKSCPVARYHSRKAIEKALELDHRKPGLAKTVKKTYLNLVHLLMVARLKPVIALVRRLSLMQLTFSATK